MIKDAKHTSQSQNRECISIPCHLGVPRRPARLGVWGKLLHEREEPDKKNHDRTRVTASPGVPMFNPLLLAFVACRATTGQPQVNNLHRQLLAAKHRLTKDQEP